MIHYKKLEASDLEPELLKNFDRSEEVHQAWRRENGEWILIDVDYQEHWNLKELTEIAIVLKQTLLEGGAVWAAFERENLVGFASVKGKLFGSKTSYAELAMLHITRSHRGQGIGRVLFKNCAEEALALGATKLYISASSSETSQAFYKALGCVDAKEVNEQLAQLEPYDRQLELNLEDYCVLTPCGMNCRVCSAFLRKKNKCQGCRVPNDYKPKTRVECKIKNCDHLKQHGAQFCYECLHFPCKLILHMDGRYQTKYHMSTLQNLKDIENLGIEGFLKTEQTKWACKTCGGTICVHTACCFTCGSAKK